jgi:hypothetical protein
VKNSAVYATLQTLNGRFYAEFHELFTCEELTKA